MATDRELAPADPPVGPTRWALLPLGVVLGYCAGVLAYLALATTRDSGGSSCGRLLAPDFAFRDCQDVLTNRYIFAAAHLAVALGAAAVASLCLRRRTDALRAVAIAAGAVALIAALGVAVNPIHPSDDSTCGSALQPRNYQGSSGSFCREKVTSQRWGVAGLLALSGSCAAVAVQLGRRRRAFDPALPDRVG